jgi:hypothetical protein
VVASFGTGYVTDPINVKGTFAGYFLNNAMTKDLYVGEPVQVNIISNMLYCQTLRAMWDEGKGKVLDWFRSE